MTLNTQTTTIHHATGGLPPSDDDVPLVHPEITRRGGPPQRRRVDHATKPPSVRRRARRAAWPLHPALLSSNMLSFSKAAYARAIHTFDGRAFEDALPQSLDPRQIPQSTNVACARARLGNRGLAAPPMTRVAPPGVPCEPMTSFSGPRTVAAFATRRAPVFRA